MGGRMPVSEAIEKPGMDGGAAVLLHGGAWDIPPGQHEAHLLALRDALGSARGVLEKDGGALDAAAAAVGDAPDDGFPAGPARPAPQSGRQEAQG